MGQAQISFRDGKPIEPVDAMVQAAEVALTDAGAPGLRARIQKVGCPVGISPYRNPARMVAADLGCEDVVTATTLFGGNAVYDLLITAVEEIQAGVHDVVLVCAAETLRTRRHDRQAGFRSRYRTEPAGAKADELIDRTEAEPEQEWWLGTWNDAAQFYAAVETVIRHRNGETPDGHVARVARLWSSFSQAAAADPTAWIRGAVPAEDIATVSAGNRLVAYPYRKLMTANPDVDQAAAILLCTAETARHCGVERDRWVFPWSASGGSDHSPRARWHLDESPALRTAAARALGLAGLGIDDCEFVDVYACFPSAVQVAVGALGIGPDRIPTVTGGSTFHGGPPNSYGLHAAARTAELLRGTRGGRALISGVGGLLDHHSVLVLATQPPVTPFQHDRPQAEISAQPARPTPPPLSGRAAIEGYTISYDREATPIRALAACVASTGERVWAVLTHADDMGRLASGDACGSTVDVVSEGAGASARLV